MHVALNTLTNYVNVLRKPRSISGRDPSRMKPDLRRTCSRRARRNHTPHAEREGGLDVNTPTYSSDVASPRP